MPPDEPITLEELARIEAEYRGMPPFGKWEANESDLSRWTAAAVHLRSLSDAVDEHDLAAALESTMRAAAWDTGAIEGLYSSDRGVTITIATQAAAWEAAADAHGAQARAFFEAQLGTYELVLDVATSAMPVTEAWIRRLHEELTSPQERYVVHTAVGPQEQPLPRGRYKLHPNHVRLADGRVHAYAPVEQTPTEMANFVETLNSEHFGAAHPVLQAAYAHYGLVAIHPFADGNGRVARALASVYFYRAANVPLLVFLDQRDEYFAALADADSGRPESFIPFIAECGLSALVLAEDGLRAGSAPKATDIFNDLRSLMTSHGGLLHPDVDAHASALVGKVASAFEQKVNGLEPPTGTTIVVGSGSGQGLNPPEGYRHIVHGGTPYVALNMATPAPAAASRMLEARVFVAATRRDDEAFVLTVPHRPEEAITFRVQDVHPALTAAAELRISYWAERLLALELSDLVSDARLALGVSPYRT